MPECSIQLQTHMLLYNRLSLHSEGFWGFSAISATLSIFSPHRSHYGLSAKKTSLYLDVTTLPASQFRSESTTIQVSKRRKRSCVIARLKLQRFTSCASGIFDQFSSNTPDINSQVGRTPLYACFEVAWDSRSETSMVWTPIYYNFTFNFRSTHLRSASCLLCFSLLR